MNVQMEYTAVELIATLSMNIANVWEIARKNYQEGSKEFNELVSATVRPVQILHELVLSQGVTNKHFKNNALLKAKRELDKELNN